MGVGFAAVTEDDGVLVTSADVNGFTVSELRLPPGYRQAAFDPPLPYLALVLEGSMVKSFRARTMHFQDGSAFTMPAGMWHGARFGTAGATIVIVRPRSESTPLTAAFGRLVELRGPGFNWLAWRLAAELRAADAAAPLAAEGFALELLAGDHAGGDGRTAGRPTAALARVSRRVPSGAHLRASQVARVGGRRRREPRPPGPCVSGSVRDLRGRVRSPAAAGLGRSGDRPRRQADRRDRHRSRLRRSEPLHTPVQTLRRNHPGALSRRSDARSTLSTRVQHFRVAVAGS